MHSYYCVLVKNVFWTVKKLTEFLIALKKPNNNISMSKLSFKPSPQSLCSNSMQFCKLPKGAKRCTPFSSAYFIIFADFLILPLNPFNIREKVEAGEEKTINLPNFKRRMPRESCWRKSTKVSFWRVMLGANSHRVEQLPTRPVG